MQIKFISIVWQTKLRYPNRNKKVTNTKLHLLILLNTKIILSSNSSIRTKKLKYGAKASNQLRYNLDFKNIIPLL